MSEFLTFSKMDESGNITGEQTLSIETIKNCPTLVFLPEHYRKDGSCRHDEPNCEQDGCSNLKFEEEIYCEQHCGY